MAERGGGARSAPRKGERRNTVRDVTSVDFQRWTKAPSVNLPKGISGRVKKVCVKESIQRRSTNVVPAAESSGYSLGNRLFELEGPVSYNVADGERRTNHVSAEYIQFLSCPSSRFQSACGFSNNIRGQ